jgi:cytoskeleton protein RodZ
MSETAQALGARLKAAREERGVSAQKMGDDMHLDAWVIEALEAGDYERIGPSVYARGHLKKYASILGVSTDPAEPKPKPAGPPAPVPIVRIDPPSRVEHLWPKVGGVAVIVLVAGGIAWWRPWHRAASVGTAAALPAPSPSAAPAASQSHAGEAETAPAGDDASDVAARESALATTVVTPSGADYSSSSAAAPNTAGAPGSAAIARNTGAPVKGAAPMKNGAALAGAAGSGVGAAGPGTAVTPGSAAAAEELTPGVGRARLRLSFSADSRVDVYDYAGKALFAGDGRANSVKTLSGMAPFRVYLGSAGGVQLEVNDRAVAIGRQFVVGDVARFEAGADGVLRRDSHPSSTNSGKAAAVSP